RLGEMLKLFARRYGVAGSAAWIFPDDDAGRDDLWLFLHAQAHTVPTADRAEVLCKVIKERAPFLGAIEREKLAAKVARKPLKHKSATLATRLNLTDQERSRLRLRTIGAVDMTKAERAERARKRRNAARKAKRRRVPREQWLAKHSISRTKPWDAEG